MKQWTTVRRYVSLWLSFAKNSLTREMEYKGNFIVDIGIEVLWTLVTLFALEMLLFQSETIGPNGTNRFYQIAR